ncbi:TRAP transporter large permease [Metabacillus rhizolycopersici]|uniref:TRAP transporter large permease n=1 Tax=Metabacillus rhizolycopersici TaxID=2875709 RepID=A0ABS7UNB0_9BACI|nr:TRAP transporter large permease [Metabacillus rhizolycopersici]MBZ5749651.1 TRAP transporter large permease [Metabacillus rhizolycopersici]
MTLTAGIILLAVFFILLFAGVPIAISIAGASIATMLIIFPFDVAVFTSAQKMVTGLDSFALLAVPFFVLSGIIMNNGGIAIRLINLAKVLAGRTPGSLDHTNVIGNMLFGSISGSSVAAAAAIGQVMAPLQEKDGYDRTYSAAVNIASAPTGLLIPPSGLLIIYSLVSGGTSVAALFMAGYIPGILWGLSTMVVAYFIAKKKKYPITNKVTFKQGLKVFLDAIPSLLLIFIVLGGIIYGVFTATEGAAIAVAYSVILSIFYKSFSLKKLPAMLLETVEMTAVIMLVIATSTILSIVMSFTGIPEAISNGVLGLTDNPIIILLMMNIILLIIGTFIDLAPAVLIFTPIFLPIVSSFGMDPVHFGIMMAFNLCIGNITPPVGGALFAGCSVGKVSIEQVTKPLFPFYGAITIVLLLVTYIPEVSLFLPKLFGL